MAATTVERDAIPLSDRPVVNYWTTCGGGCGKRVWHQASSSSDHPVCVDCRKKLRQRVCEYCGNAFEVRHSGVEAKFCSNGCRSKASIIIREELLCEGCGEYFTPKNRVQKSCSMRCNSRLRDGWKGGVSPKQLPRHTVFFPLQICSECGSGFFWRGKRLTCGRECSRVHNNRVSCASIMARYRSDPEFRDRVISIAQARRADKLGIEEITTRTDLIAYLMEEFDGICQICGDPIPDKEFDKHDPDMPSIDHAIPVSRGGSHALDNLQLAHYVCNLSKGNSTITMATEEQLSELRERILALA